MKSEAGNVLLRSLLPTCESVIRLVNAGEYVQIKALLAKESESLLSLHQASADDTFLNDLYILGRLLALQSSYAAVWEDIALLRFAASWVSLQNSLDCIRSIKRLSGMELNYFEEQLLHLERCYPYKIFASIGMIASRIECSICQHDIDSLECIHRRGRLYAGRMAYGIVKDCVSFDHVSLVTNPEDKRCVITIPDESGKFGIVRYLGRAISERKMLVSEFDRVEITQQRIPNPAYRKLGRNDRCFCKSGKKFKACCINQTYVEGENAKICGSHKTAITHFLPQD